MIECVVDASVVLTWCFPDEHSAEAARILRIVRAPGTRVVVPAFFHHEVLNALLAGERRKRITPDATREFMADLLMLPFIPVIQDRPSIDAVQALSRKHGLTSYDAAYLEIADRFSLPLASFDKALVSARGAAGTPEL